MEIDKNLNIIADLVLHPHTRGLILLSTMSIVKASDTTVNIILSSESNTLQFNIDVKVHIPTDNVYSVNRRARTSQQNLELFEANIYHERKLTMQGYREG